MRTHVCPRCKVEKPLTAEFWYSNIARDNQYAPYCRPCDAMHKKEFHERVGRDRARARRALRRTPCPKCGALKGATSIHCMACRELPNGPAHGNWTGGRVENAQGYMMVRAPSDHPNSNKSGYITEHRLVMERSLGRLLLPNENVHHRNGVKTDNRIENLELWVKTQPCGQRPSDLVAHAKAILSTYEPEALASCRVLYSLDKADLRVAAVG